MTPNDVKIVADNIDDFIEVPDGTERLRKAILTLAVAGKLVTQDKKEGTGEDLYAEIQTERLGSKKNKKGSVLSPVSEDVPFDIPKSWKWVPLLEIYTSITPPEKLKTAAMETEGKWPVVDQGERFISGYTSSAKPIRADIPMVIFGDHTLNVKYVDFDFVAGADGTKILKPIVVYPKYFFLLIQQFKPQSRGYSRHFKQLNQKVVPLPPMGEQKRIVAKVEELMKQLDELETKKLERDEVRTRLARSAMQSLGKGESKIAFDYLAELVKTPSDIKELENALLTLAVSGKLVPLESRVSVSKSKDKPLLPASEGVSFKLPVLWSWPQFKDKNLLQIIDGDRGRNYPSKSEFADKGYCLFLSTSNVRKGEFAFSKCDFITKEKDESLRKGKLAREDVVLTTRGTIGNTAYFSHDIPFDNVRINSGMVILRCDTTKIFPPYLIVFLKSSIFISQTNQLMSGSAQQQLPIKVLSEIYFPLPPLAEQKRIVKKVEEVTVLINRLKQVV